MAARPEKLRLWLLAGGAACAFVVLVSCAAAPFFIGWWLDSSDKPERSDLLMVLCGQEYSRAVYAAELYKSGYAPEVWLSRVEADPSVRLANSLGVKVLNEDEVFEAILLRKGVPRDRLRRYGSRVLSTVGEARAFRAEASPDGKSVLAVTSRYHARRARIVLRRTLPRSRVLVSADPAEPFTRRWWTRRDLAKSGLLETAKAAYYLMGGEFASKSAPLP